MAARPDEPAQPRGERRRVDRRKYNRRQTDREIAPPYFETFDRIATALEHIEELLRDSHRPATPDDAHRQ